MIAVVIAILGLSEPASPPAPGSRLPESLRAALSQRDRVQTGWIEYAATDFRRERKPIYFTAEFTPNEVLTLLHGDEKGYIGDELRPDKPYGTLNTPSGTFEHEGDYIHGVVSSPTLARAYSPLSFGLGVASAFSARRLNEVQAEWDAPDRNLRFEERREGDLVVVTRYDDKFRTTWWLDPKREFNPVRIRTESDGSLVSETRIALDQFDGAWFPREVATYRADAAGEQAPVQILSVIAASFNQPDQPKVLTPADAGFEPGMLVENREPQASGPQLIWDGEKPVPDYEFHERVRAGEIKRGARNRAALDARPAAPPELIEAAQRGLRSDETAPSALGARLRAWKRYTEDFIKRFGLDDDQAQKARQLLADCEDRARQYVSGHRDRFDPVERDLETAARSGARDDRGRARERLAELLKPVDEIFEDVLKPRLEKIPTRAQRDGLEAAQQRRAAEARTSLRRPDGAPAPVPSAGKSP